MTQRMKRFLTHRRADLLAAGLGFLLLAGYLYNLTGWKIFDDEGEYLYQIWRMTLGEIPYQDFLTPQLPVFLYSGTAVMEIAGVALLPIRTFTVLLAFASGALLYLAGRRHHGALAGALTAVLFLLHSDVFRETRIYRNEPFLLLFVTAGLVIATWDVENVSLRRLVAAGLCFGLATMSKLFGLLPAAGVGLWLLWRWWQRRAPLVPVLRQAAALGGPLILVVGLIAGAFSLLVPHFFELTVGHHLAQGSDLAATTIAQNKLGLFAEYAGLYPIFSAAAIVSALIGLYRGDARTAWAWQLPLVLSFFVLSRQLGQRHFMFILPAASLLIGWLLADALAGRYRGWGRAFALVALAGILVPAVQTNLYRASWVDHETPEIVALIQEHTEPGETILADDIGLAYYARRPTTYSGAALSHGAVTSGQITGEILIDEIVADDVRMVIVDESLLTGNHMVYLRDYPRFHRFLEQNFDYLGSFRRDYQELGVWLRGRDAPIVVDDPLTIPTHQRVRFGDNLLLLGYRLPGEPLQPGDTVHFTLYWTADAPADHYWSVFTHLRAPDGSLAGQHDKVPYGGLYPPTRWWSGQIVDDDYAIQIPEDAPAGEYRIAVGMYDWQTGERLPLRDDAGAPMSNGQVFLEQSITVRP